MDDGKRAGGEKTARGKTDKKDRGNGSIFPLERPTSDGTKPHPAILSLVRLLARDAAREDFERERQRGEPGP
jgi:hypothetical protein